jgi:hypothetical protein
MQERHRALRPCQMRIDKVLFFHKNRGDYGETVITPVCGTGITGSIPVSRPIKKLLRMQEFFNWVIVRESNARGFGGTAVSPPFPGEI